MFFVFSWVWDKLKTYHLSYSIYKYDTINIADPDSICPRTCHMNFVIDLTHRRVSVAQ